MGHQQDHRGEDRRLWRALCAEVKPLKSPVSEAKGLMDAEREGDGEALRSGSKPLLRPEAGYLSTWSGGEMTRSNTPRLAQRVREVPRFYAHMDGRMQHRFRTGKITPEAKLDLHGLTESRAAEVFARFFTGAQRRGLRCVMVVTGKGQGVLQRALARWLEAPAVRQSLIGVAPMPGHKGGAGAYCLYLRKTATRSL